MRSLIALFLIALSFPLAAQTPRKEMVVTPEWLVRNLRRVVVVEIGDAETYAAAHIPGARSIGSTEIVTQRDNARNELPTIAALEGVFTRAGVGDRGRIIIYSRNPQLAARAWFTLDYAGHGRRAALLDGGFERWVALGLPTAAGNEPVEPIPFHAAPGKRVVTDLKAIKDLVRYREVLGSSVVLIDARPSRDFGGKNGRNDSSRRGHIPGATNVPWDENLVAGEVPRLLPEHELRELYVSAGVTSKSSNVIYCHTGMQASLTYFVLHYLGYEAILYDGSFEEWSGDPTTLVVETRQASARGR